MTFVSLKICFFKGASENIGVEMNIPRLNVIILFACTQLGNKILKCTVGGTGEMRNHWYPIQQNRSSCLFSENTPRNLWQKHNPLFHDHQKDPPSKISERTRRDRCIKEETGTIKITRMWSRKIENFQSATMCRVLEWLGYFLFNYVTVIAGYVN